MCNYFLRSLSIVFNVATRICFYSQAQLKRQDIGIYSEQLKIKPSHFYHGISTYQDETFKTKLH